MSNSASDKRPQRMCVACRQMMDKSLLIRIVRSKDGEYSIDNAGKMPGRGAYVCSNEDCLRQLVKKKALNKAFGCAVSESVYGAIKDEYDRRQN